MSTKDFNFFEATARNIQNQNFELEGLVPGTLYRVRVAAISTAGIGVFSNISTARTFKCKFKVLCGELKHFAKHAIGLTLTGSNTSGKSILASWSRVL